MSGQMAAEGAPAPMEESQKWRHSMHCLEWWENTHTMFYSVLTRCNFRIYP